MRGTRYFSLSGSGEFFAAHGLSVAMLPAEAFFQRSRAVEKHFDPFRLKNFELRKG
jgi:hypothetical protein